MAKSRSSSEVVVNIQGGAENDAAKPAIPSHTVPPCPDGYADLPRMLLYAPESGVPLHGDFIRLESLGSMPVILVRLVETTKGKGWTGTIEDVPAGREVMVQQTGQLEGLAKTVFAFMNGQLQGVTRAILYPLGRFINPDGDKTPDYFIRVAKTMIPFKQPNQQ